MKRIKIFISSVQNEFAQERKLLTEYLQADVLLGKFFEPFIFEQLPANDHTAENTYFTSVEKSDIYLGLLGKKYGFEDAEAIVNAVVHRDYTSNASVQVMVFRDRVEIWNPGTLPLGWNTAKLKELHNSVPANPLIAEPMYLAAYIERLGTGTTDMIDFARKANLPEPEFIQEDMFRTIIYKKKHKHVTPQVTPQVIRLIQSVNGVMSREEIQKELNLSDKKNYVKNYQNKAIEKGYLEMTEPDSPNSPTQKYRLTKKGLVLKRKLK